MARQPAKRTLDARPDRADFRDKPYLPPLRSLPDQYPAPDLIERHFAAYKQANLVLNQGNEGACTGFGLAAFINYTYWSQWRAANIQREARMASGEVSADAPTPQMPTRVSAHMLFRNARIYDEWDGSDYDWSSCRGAMKGWHKHGVCEEAIWPKPGRRPSSEWQYDAALRPLGAYYRVNAKSIADMQAAIFEVNAVYCSADVHSGWNRPKRTLRLGAENLALIEQHDKIEGGHAFAVVGYNRFGFIVQNSWGPGWGTNGFALLTYEDWAKNGYDAWVAAIGAPMDVSVRRGAASGSPIGSMLTAGLSTLEPTVRKGNRGVPPWDPSWAYQHAVVLGNDGVLLDRLPEAVSAADALDIVASERILASDSDRVAVYVHGGLNDEEGAIERACRLGPWFVENGIHPIFIVWKTGIIEALGQIAADDVKKLEEQIKAVRTRGVGDFIDAAVERIREAFDLGFEAVAEQFIAKAVWTQMKQNAEASARNGRGLAELVKKLATCGKPVHVLGHSAGSIMIGHMLAPAQRAGLKIASCSLFAPACTLDFALRRFGPAMKRGGALASGQLAIDNLSDAAETRDSVGPYGKSLLYLVSRALEERRKSPLLGLEIALQAKGEGPRMAFDRKLHEALYAEWKSLVSETGRVSVKYHKGPDVRISSDRTARIAHGTFDNDCDVINASLKRIRGGRLTAEVTDLTGF